jgi:hypothetical protein
MPQQSPFVAIAGGQALSIKPSCEGGAAAGLTWLQPASAALAASASKNKRRVIFLVGIDLLHGAATWPRHSHSLMAAGTSRCSAAAAARRFAIRQVFG